MFQHIMLWAALPLVPTAVNILLGAYTPEPPAPPDQYAFRECLIMTFMGLVAATCLSSVVRCMLKQPNNVPSP